MSAYIGRLLSVTTAMGVYESGVTEELFGAFKHLKAIK